mmetsp:Transcript_32381/g.82548  ORF Transcript_32381/g.82548 Transcript_32381/m.82548 type:complete len:288 (+) Transcript_32381:174-1037(+)
MCRASCSLGTSSCVGSGKPVRGEVLCDASHCSMAARSYVWPSAVMTGSSITACVIGQTKLDTTAAPCWPLPPPLSSAAMPAVTPAASCSVAASAAKLCATCSLPTISRSAWRVLTTRRTVRSLCCSTSRWMAKVEPVVKSTERRRLPSSTVTAPSLPLKPRSMRALVSSRYGDHISSPSRMESAPFTRLLSPCDPLHHCQMTSDASALPGSGAEEARSSAVHTRMEAVGGAAPVPAATRHSSGIRLTKVRSVSASGAPGSHILHSPWIRLPGMVVVSSCLTTRLTVR